MVEMSGQEIYDNFHDGVGPEGLATGAALVKKIAGRYQERAHEIHQLACEMESAWQGDAAGGAQRGAGPLLTEHEVAGHHFTVSEDLADRQSGSFSRARNSVVPVPPGPSDVPPWGPLSPDWVPFEQRVQQHNDAARHNVDVMNVYSGASTYNTDHLPTSYGSLAGDESGVVVDDADMISSEVSRDTTDDPGPNASGHDSGPGAGSVSVAPAHGQPGDHNTTPGGYSPAPGQLPGTQSPVTDSGQGRPSPVNGPPTGVGLVGPVEVGLANAAKHAAGQPVTGDSPGARPRSSGEFRRGGMPVPREVAPDIGARPTTSTPTRSTSASPPATGRSMGTGVHGVPLGPGRGRADDKERTSPTYLEGGDPEDLFGAEVLTAPPAIGDEDDD